MGGSLPLGMVDWPLLMEGLNKGLVLPGTLLEPWGAPAMGSYWYPSLEWNWPCSSSVSSLHDESESLLPALVVHS